MHRREHRVKSAFGRGLAHARGRRGHVRSCGARLEVTIVERAVDVLFGLLAGLLVGLVTVVLGTIGSMPLSAPEESNRCAGLMAAPLIVGSLCGGWAAWRLRRTRPPESRWRR